MIVQLHISLHGPATPQYGTMQVCSNNISIPSTLRATVGAKGVGPDADAHGTWSGLSAACTVYRNSRNGLVFVGGRRGLWAHVGDRGRRAVRTSCTVRVILAQSVPTCADRNTSCDLSQARCVSKHHSTLYHDHLHGPIRQRTSVASRSPSRRGTRVVRGPGWR